MGKYYSIHLVITGIFMTGVLLYWLHKVTPPEDVAISFVEAYLRNDMDAAGEYTTSSVSFLYSIMESPKLKKVDTKRRLNKAVIADCVGNKYHQNCTVCCDQYNQSYSIDLKYSSNDKAWQVDMETEVLEDVFGDLMKKE